MRKRFLWVLFFFALFLGGISSWAVAYKASPYLFRRPAGHKLKDWFKRDLLPCDQRAQVVLALREIRSYLARAEALGLSSTEKAALNGLREALEKEMAETMRHLKAYSQELERELQQETSQKEKVFELERKINALWQEITQKALTYLFKARELVQEKGPG